MIAAIRPIPEDDWDEKTEIERALSAYDQHVQEIGDELENTDRQIAARTGQKSVTGLLSVRVNLLRELRQTYESRSAFLMDIGYVKRAPQRLLVGRDKVSELEGETLDKEIETLEQEIAAEGPDGPNGD